jgi:hypothetical protein
VLYLRPFDEVSSAAIDLVAARGGKFARAGELLLDPSLLADLALMILLRSWGSMGLLLLYVFPNQQGYLFRWPPGKWRPTHLEQLFRR